MSHLNTDLDEEFDLDILYAEEERANLLATHSDYYENQDTSILYDDNDNDEVVLVSAVIQTTTDTNMGKSSDKQDKNSDKNTDKNRPNDQTRSTSKTGISVQDYMARFAARSGKSAATPANSEPTASTSTATDSMEVDGACANPPTTFAAVVQRHDVDPTKVLTVFQTTYTKQPLTMPNFLWLRKTLRELISATNLSDTSITVKCPILPRDTLTGGMPIVPQDEASRDWMMRALQSITNGNTEFKAWRVGEEPAKEALNFYICDDHDALDDEEVMTLLHKLNADMPRDYDLESVTAQLDKYGHRRGRLFQIKAGDYVYAYCKTRNFMLHFSGEKIECITATEKNRRQRDKFEQRKAETASSKRTDSNRDPRRQPPPRGNDGASKKPKT
jgi:hypothetical protein